MFFMRCSESGRISIDSTRRPPTAADISCTLGAPTAKKNTSILPDLKSSDARITFTVGTFFTSFIDTPPAASSAFRCVMTLVCCTQSEGMFLPLRSAMVWIGESLRTQNAIWKPNRLIARRMLGFGLPFQTFSPFIASAGSPTSSSSMSACFELTASMMPVSPPWPMTRTWSLLLSCTTLAITEACALSSVPGCRVAKPTVCCPNAAPANAAMASAQSIFGCMNPPPRVAAILTGRARHRRGGVAHGLAYRFEPSLYAVERPGDADGEGLGLDRERLGDAHAAGVVLAARHEVAAAARLAQVGEQAGRVERVLGEALELEPAQLLRQAFVGQRAEQRLAHGARVQRPARARMQAVADGLRALDRHDIEDLVAFALADQHRLFGALAQRLEVRQQALHHRVVRRDQAAEVEQLARRVIAPLVEHVDVAARLEGADDAMAARDRRSDQAREVAEGERLLLRGKGLEDVERALGGLYRIHGHAPASACPISFFPRWPLLPRRTRPAPRASRSPGAPRRTALA